MDTLRNIILALMSCLAIYACSDPTSADRNIYKEQIQNNSVYPKPVGIGNFWNYSVTLVSNQEISINVPATFTELMKSVANNNGTSICISEFNGNQSKQVINKLFIHYETDPFEEIMGSYIFTRSDIYIEYPLTNGNKWKFGKCNYEVLSTSERLNEFQSDDIVHIKSINSLMNFYTKEFFLHKDIGIVKMVYSYNENRYNRVFKLIFELKDYKIDS